MTYSDALKALKGRCTVQRKGWNGKGMWLTLFSNSNFCIQESPKVQDFPMEDDEICVGFLVNDIFCRLQDFILMKTVGNTFVPWFPSQTDMLADDWEIMSAKL